MSWVGELRLAALHSWQLPAVEARLQRAQAGLAAQSAQFTLTAPFDALDAARARARAGPPRLWGPAAAATAVS